MKVDTETLKEKLIRLKVESDLAREILRLGDKHGAAWVSATIECGLLDRIENVDTAEQTLNKMFNELDALITQPTW